MKCIDELEHIFAVKGFVLLDREDYEEIKSEVDDLERLEREYCAGYCKKINEISEMIKKNIEGVKLLEQLEIELLYMGSLTKQVETFLRDIKRTIE